MPRYTSLLLGWLPSVLVVTLIALAVFRGAAFAQSYFVNETADGSANAVGYYASLALDAQGNPHVSYQDNTTSDLKYARKRGGIWTIETADGSANQRGLFTSLALDAQGNPHVSYLDDTTGDLKYAREVGRRLDERDGGRVGEHRGHYTSLALDAQGNPHVSYQDCSTCDLKYARKSGGVWTIETADASANSRGLLHLARPGRPGEPPRELLGRRRRSTSSTPGSRAGSGRSRRRTGRRTSWVLTPRSPWTRRGTRT